VIVGVAGIAWYANRKLTQRSVHVDVHELQHCQLPDDTLFPLLQPHLISIAELAQDRGYSSVLHLVQAMIGVQPTCDMALEIWPPAFETYNLILPGFLNFPELLLPPTLSGAAPKELVSIAMYASSKANGCAYCTAHTCSFALRRGVDPQVLGNILRHVQEKGNKSESDPSQNTRQAVVKVAYGVGTVPATLQPADVQDIYDAMKNQSHVEWIVAAAAMFGAYNKFMDGLGIPLEDGAYAETKAVMDQDIRQFEAGKAGSMLPKEPSLSPIPPKDDWKLILACLVQGVRPGGALALDKRLHGDTPNDKAGCLQYLRNRFGTDFGLVIDHLHNLRLIRTMTAIITKNMDDGNSAGLCLSRKVVAGMAFCDVLENPRLAKELEAMAAKFPPTPSERDSEEEKERMKLLLKVTKALSYTPNRVTPALVKQLREKEHLISAQMLVELVAFLAIVQLLHRFETFFHVGTDVIHVK